MRKTAIRSREGDLGPRPSQNPEVHLIRPEDFWSADITSRDVEQRGDPMFEQQGSGLRQVVVVTVVEGDQERARRQAASTFVMGQNVGGGNRREETLEDLQMALKLPRGNRIAV